MLSYVLIGMVFGVVTEVCARVLRLWVYRQAQTPVLNVIVVSGLIMGAIAMLVPRHGIGLAFVLGFAVGLIYEGANLLVLNWWDFPEQRLGFIRGNLAIAVVASMGWGMVPLMTAGVHAALPRTLPLMAAPQSRLDTLNEREKALTEKLAALRQRQHDVESRLDAVRRRKQLVLDKQKTGRSAPTAPTPP